MRVFKNKHWSIHNKRFDEIVPHPTSLYWLTFILWLHFFPHIHQRALTDWSPLKFLRLQPSYSQNSGTLRCEGAGLSNENHLNTGQITFFQYSLYYRLKNQNVILFVRFKFLFIRNSNVYIRLKSVRCNPIQKYHPLVIQPSTWSVLRCLRHGVSQSMDYK